MAKKKKIDLKLIVAEALDYYHNYVKKTIKESTKRQNESLLSEFYRFVDTLPARDKTMKIFSQKGLNRYKEYLIDKMERSKTDGKKRNFGVGQLNRCGAIIALLINRVLVDKEDGIVRVIWNKVDDPRREDQKGHFPLLENEVTAIENCSGLTPAEEEYRDIFLLQIECGQRVSDLAKILTGKYRVKQGKKFKYIIISTIKENIKAHIPLRPKMRMWMEKVNSHKLITPVKFEKIVNGKGNGIYNQAIRRIVKKAGLDREIVRINSLLLEVRGPLYEEITNHAARCTFITNMLKKGVSPKQVSKMTGHASEEMINRVYAQLEEDDEINLIESDLFSDMDDDNANAFNDISSKNPNEQETFVHEEVAATMSISADSEPSLLFESDENNVYENYIRNLNDKVDEAINEINEFFQDIDEEFVSKVDYFHKSIIDRINKNKQQFKSKEDIIIFWQNSEAKIKENPDPDDAKFFIDFERLIYIRILIDYLKSNHIFEDAIESLEDILHTICAENPKASIESQNMYYIKVVLPIEKFRVVFFKMMQFIRENRPIADETMLEDNNSKFKSRIDWDLVFKELQKTPAMKLDALIQNTNCSHDVKTVLYNSITKGDFNTFYTTIKTHENDVRILLINAYDNHFERMKLKLNDYLYKIAESEPDNYFELRNQAIEKLLLYNPYVDKGEDESIPDFMLTNVQEADIREQQLWILDTVLKMFDDCYKYTYPSEKKIFNKVRSLVDFNKYPELKDAYDKYLAKQKAVSNQTDFEATIDSEEDKGENRMNDAIKVNYLTVDVQNIDIDKLIRLLTEKDELNKFQPFITVLESTDNVNVATCLKHFLDTPSNTPLSFRLKWNGHTKASLKFLIRLLKNTKKEASRLNVIDVSNREGISPKFVSKWTGSGELWTPVCEVFGGSPDYMMSVGLGKEGSPAREINLEQYNTIADIYFACKKLRSISKQLPQKKHRRF